MFKIGSQEVQTSKFVNGGILEWTQVWVCDAPERHYFCIDLDLLTGIAHLFIGLGFVSGFPSTQREEIQVAHHLEQALRAVGIIPLSKLSNTQVWITLEPISDQLQFCLSVLIWMAVGTPGLAERRIHRSVPADLPEIDV